jgi:pimeloyl-ACP methyl ester carboxylesterase
MKKTGLLLNTPFSYSVTGTGQPVLLLHGFGEDHRVWDPLLAALPEGFLYLIPDLPGSGASPLPEEWLQEPSIEKLAEFVRHLLETEKINTPVVLIGHSMGGYAALAFAAQYPELVKSLLLFHSTAYADSAEKKELRAKSIRFIQEHGSAAFIAQSTPNLFSDAYKKENPEKLAETIAIYSNFPEAALVWYTEAMMNRVERLDVLSNALFPVGFVIGMLDKAVPPEQSLKQASLPGISFIQVLENVAHMGMIEDPGQTGPFLEKFLLNSVMPGL